MKPEVKSQEESHVASFLNLGLSERFQLQRYLAAQETAAFEEPECVDHGMELDGAPIWFEEWRQRSEFELKAYQVRGENVVFRDVEFQTGDIILCNRSRASDGMFTTLVEGRQCFAHVAVYACLEHDGRLYPSILEIQHQGVRAVPLKVYMSRSFSTYVEVYRSRQVDESAQAKIAAVCAEMLGEVHGFDIDMDESQDVYLSCALMAAQVYRRSGLKPVQGGSRYSAATQPNLEVLGNTSSANRTLLMPDDYAKSDDLKVCGVIYFGSLHELAARALVREAMQDVWKTKTLSWKSLPLHAAIYWAAVWIIQRRVPVLARFLASKIGMRLESFPSGPTTFIALTPIVEERIERAATELAEDLKAFDHELNSLPGWKEVASHPRIRERIARRMIWFASLYESRVQSKPEVESFVNLCLDQEV